MTRRGYETGARDCLRRSVVLMILRPSGRFRTRRYWRRLKQPNGPLGVALPLMVGSCLRRPLARFLNGQALSVPLMVGSLANEGHLSDAAGADTDAAGFQRLPDAHLSPMNPAAIPEILKAYQFELEIRLCHRSA